MKDKRNKVMEMDTQEQVEAAAAEPVETMSFTDWFSHKLIEQKKLKPNHYDSVKVFFKNKNLTEHESKESFDSMLKVFGF